MGNDIFHSVQSTTQFWLPKNFGLDYKYGIIGMKKKGKMILYNDKDLHLLDLAGASLVEIKKI